MPLHLTTTDTTGKTLFATLQRLSDGAYWDNVASAWAANPAAADRKISLPEGTSANLGSYKADVTGLGNAGWIFARVHDDSDASDTTTRGGTAYVWGGEEIDGPYSVAIKAKTDLIGSSRTTITSPVAASGDVTIYQGDAYTTARGRALEWIDTGNVWPTLTGSVITLEVGDGSMVVTGEIVSDVDPQSVRVEPLGDDTDVLHPGKYEYRVVADFGGTGTSDEPERVTIAAGKFTVLDREDV